MPRPRWYAPALLIPAAHSTVIRAGDLVQLLTPEDEQDEASNAAGSSRGRRGGAQSGKGVNTRCVNYASMWLLMLPRSLQPCICTVLFQPSTAWHAARLMACLPTVGLSCSGCWGVPGLGVCSDTSWPMGFRVVEHFQLNPQESVRYTVQLREWTPSWVPGGRLWGHGLHP